MAEIPVDIEIPEILVLIVDDEPNILQSLQRLLRREAFRVVAASSGNEALGLLAGLRNVAVILSDQRMPEMNGAEFLERSRELAPDATRMLLTGYSDLDDAVNAINHGAISRYLSKPWDDLDLLQALRSGVETYALFQENKRLQDLVRIQNDELQEWNRNLKDRVLQQTTAIRQKNEELHLSIRRQREGYQSIITSFVSLVEMRGARTRLHAYNVAKLSKLVAAEMGLSSDEQDTIRTASMLHDIGEIGIAESILLTSPEALSHADLVEYSHHPVRGQLIIDPIEELRPAGLLVRHHHEKYDGTGFPDGLAGEDIPLGARIIGYADMIDRAARQSSGDVATHALNWTDIHLGTSFDPHLRTPFHRCTKYVYLPAPQFISGIEAGEREIALEHLESGMTLARSVYSGSGMLLLHSGEMLDARLIESLGRYNELDPFADQIYVTKTGRGIARKI